MKYKLNCSKNTQFTYRKYASECNTRLGLGGTATNMGSGCLAPEMLLVCVAAADVSIIKKICRKIRKYL